MNNIDQALEAIDYCQARQFTAESEADAKSWEAAEAKHEARYLRLLRDHAHTARMLKGTQP